MEHGLDQRAPAARAKQTGADEGGRVDGHWIGINLRCGRDDAARAAGVGAVGGEVERAGGVWIGDAQGEATGNFAPELAEQGRVDGGGETRIAKAIQRDEMIRG